MHKYCEIKPVKGHYEGYINGDFISSGDTYDECYKELEEFINENKEDLDID